MGLHEVIVADTHALIWWVNGDGALSEPARTALGSNAVGVAAITCWEVAHLAARQRIRLDEDALAWLRKVLAIPELQLLPITPQIAVTAASLPVRDPADRLIVATALQHGVPLVTKDGRIREANVVPTIW